ncbi:MAG: hypothetical protein M1495_22845 [Bacteroidetes bacterium]|nr:hypothetical protein [Bacteroidota bacterium]
MKRAISLLTLSVFFFVSFNNYSKTNFTYPSSGLDIQTAQKEIKAGNELMDGFYKLTSDKSLKSGLHTIFKSANGAIYCVKLKDGKADKLIVTSSEGNQIKPRIINGTGKNNQCTVCVTISKKPLVQECWKWFCK